jgi:hypothetical protein
LNDETVTSAQDVIGVRTGTVQSNIRSTSIGCVSVSPDTAVLRSRVGGIDFIPIFPMIVVDNGVVSRDGNRDKGDHLAADPHVSSIVFAGVDLAQGVLEHITFRERDEKRLRGLGVSKIDSAVKFTTSHAASGAVLVALRKESFE